MLASTIAVRSLLGQKFVVKDLGFAAAELQFGVSILLVFILVDDDIL
jgi:hypothetical protein